MFYLRAESSQEEAKRGGENEGVKRMGVSKRSKDKCGEIKKRKLINRSLMVEFKNSEVMIKSKGWPWCRD